MEFSQAGSSNLPSRIVKGACSRRGNGNRSLGCGNVSRDGRRTRSTILQCVDIACDNRDGVTEIRDDIRSELAIGRRHDGGREGSNVAEGNAVTSKDLLPRCQCSLNGIVIASSGREQCNGVLSQRTALGDLLSRAGNLQKSNDGDEWGGEEFREVFRGILFVRGWLIRTDGDVAIRVYFWLQRRLGGRSDCVCKSRSARIRAPAHDLRNF